MVLLARLYTKKIVNINVNIVLAGLLTLGLTVGVLHLTRYMGIDGRLTILAVKFICDVIFDVAIFYLLHWLANHRLPRWVMPMAKKPKRSRLAYFKDATLVQFERAMFSPVYYVVMLTTAYFWLNEDSSNREVAAMVGFATGMFATRFLHTSWMLISGRLREPTHSDELADARDLSETTAHHAKDR